MKRFSFVFLLVALGAVGIAIPTRAQTFADASLTLERAVHAEVVSGDMDRAIALYREVAESASASRADVSKALVALGRSYELIGSDEAIDFYNRLVSEFPDQPDAFLSAHEALGRLMESPPVGAEVAPLADLDYTLMMGETPFGVYNGAREYDISPDGETIVFGAPALSYRAEMYPGLENELYFVRSGSSVMHPVIEDAGEWLGAGYSRWLPRWSPDGQQILFWGKMRANEGKYTLARQDLSSGATFLISDVIKGSDMTWMPDNRRFITLGDGYDMYSQDGALIRHYEADQALKLLGGVSPDGRYLAYTMQNEDAGGYFNFNIWLLDLKSGEHVQVTRDDGKKGRPAWSLDSGSVYYKGPDNNLYKKVIGSQSPPDRITSYSNASVFHPLVLAKTGQVTFALKNESGTIFTAPAGAREAGRGVARGSSPMLSPDGRTVYYWNGAVGKRGLWSATKDGQSPKQLVSDEASTMWGGGASLSPDGNQIAYFLSEDEGEVLYTMPSQGGSPVHLFTSEDGYGPPAWSPDGQELAFADGRDLRVISVGGGIAESLAQLSQANWDGDNVAWSPDGRYVASFADLEAQGSDTRWKSELYAFDRRTGEVKRFQDPYETSFKEGLSWHPDGDRISYIDHQQPQDGPNIVGTRLASVTGGQFETLMTSPDPRHWIGSWGPDGRYYFLKDKLSMGMSDLYVISEGGGDPEPVVLPGDGRSMNMLPSWSQDGSVMAWSEWSASTQIWSVTDRK